MIRDDLRQVLPTPLLTALGRAQAAAHPTGEYVGQESFMRASEVWRLADQAGIGPGVPVLDLCCGVAGELPCRFEQARHHRTDHRPSAVE